jgi:dihydrofolate reductase
MLIYSMSVSVDGFIAGREGAFGWTAPNDEQFRFHVAQTRELGGCLCGRRLYETMLVWETDPSMRDDELGAAFADVWCAIPKVVFSRTLDSVQGNARLAEASVAEEAAAALDATDKDVSIGGAGLAAAAIGLGLVDELIAGAPVALVDHARALSTSRGPDGARRRIGSTPSSTAHRSEWGAPRRRSRTGPARVRLAVVPEDVVHPSPTGGGGAGRPGHHGLTGTPAHGWGIVARFFGSGCMTTFVALG